MDQPIIRVFHADDHLLLREGVRALLSTEPDIELVGEAEDGASAIQKIKQINPHIVLLDLKMPVKSGLEVIKALRAEGFEGNILVLTSFADDENVFAAIKAGALGYLLKDTPPADLIRAIRDVNAGKSSLHPIIARKLIEELNSPSTLPPTDDPLTERELEVLKLIAQGLTNQQMATQLVVSERTIRTHVSNILTKLHLANRTQAALYALREGYANLGDALSSDQ